MFSQQESTNAPGSSLSNGTAPSAQSSSAVTTAPSVPATPQNWKLLFSSLINIKPEELDFEVDDSSDQLIIKTSDPSKAELLKRLLSSPEAVRNNIAYSIKSIVPERPAARVSASRSATGSTSPANSASCSLSAASASCSASSSAASSSSAAALSAAAPIASDAAAVAPQPLTPIPAPIMLKPNMGQEFFKRILGDILGQRVGNIEWNGEFGEDCVLYAEHDPLFASIMKLQVRFYQKALSTASFLQLRNALAIVNPSALPAELLRDNSVGPLALITNKIICQKNYQGRQVIQFDYGLLYRSLVMPTISLCPISAQSQPLLAANHAAEEEVKENAENQVSAQEEVKNAAERFEIRMHKNHFLSYLSSLFQEGFVLAIDHSAPGQAYPLVFNAPRSIKLETFCALILDCSGSMGTGFAEYIAKVKHFISELRSHNSNSHVKIRIAPFATTSQPILECDLSEERKITNFLDALSADNRTFLDGTLAKEFNYLKGLQDRANVTVIAFTDGEDNETPDEKKRELEQITQQLNQSSKPPRFYGLGLGNELNVAQLERLANITNGTYIPLQTLADFSQIEQHLDNICQAQIIFRIVQGVKRMDVPVYEGKLVRGSQPIQLPGNFSAGGRHYHVEAQLRQVPIEYTAVLEVRAPLPPSEPFVIIDASDTLPDAPVAEAVEPEEVPVEGAAQLNAIEAEATAIIAAASSSASVSSASAPASTSTASSARQPYVPVRNIHSGFLGFSVQSSTAVNFSGSAPASSSAATANPEGSQSAAMGISDNQKPNKKGWSESCIVS